MKSLILPFTPSLFTIIFNTLFMMMLLSMCSFSQRFDFIHKKQSGGSGQYGRIIGKLEVSGKTNQMFCHLLHICSNLNLLRVQIVKFTKGNAIEPLKLYIYHKRAVA